VTTRTWLPGCLLLLGLAGCDSLPAEPAATPEPAVAALEPGPATQQVDSLAARLDAGEPVEDREFARALAPFEKARFDSWAEVDLLRLLTAFQHLRTSLVTRYRIEDQICADDSWVRYSLCDPGYPCVASVQLSELHCLWYLSH
jgi:hypothetical protein